MNNTISLDLFDTSLRDGSQKRKDYPTDVQAALIAYVLAELGIGHIEIGVPAAESQTKERLELIIDAVGSTGKSPVLYGFCRCVKSDIDAVLNKMEKAKNKGVNIVVSGSELFQVLRSSELKEKNWEDLTGEEITLMEDKIIESIKTQVKYASSFFENVRVCFEDGSMGKRDFLVRAIKAASDSGAGVVSIPDTLGGILPDEIGDLFTYLLLETKEQQKKGLKFAIHAHDDRGLALANSLSAVKAGVTSIEGVLIGAGERVGNLNLKDFIGNIATLEEGRLIKGKKPVINGIVLSNLYETCKIIHDVLGVTWDSYSSFVGEMCTKTQVGIHQSLENKSSEQLKEFLASYGRITPYSFLNTNEFGVPQLETNMYTNLSGFSNLESCLKPYGVQLDKNNDLSAKILSGIQADLNNTKVVYASRVYTEYLIQSGEIKPITHESIIINNDNVSLNLIIGGNTVVLESEITEKDGILGTTVNAINDYIGTDYEVMLTEFSLNMHKGEHIITDNYPSLKKVYEDLQLSNGNDQIGISIIEGIFKNKLNGYKIPFITTAHDLHGDIANIKAILYACIPLIYEKSKSNFK